jgi:hypothetical protein
VSLTARSSQIEMLCAPERHEIVDSPRLARRCGSSATGADQCALDASPPPAAPPAESNDMPAIAAHPSAVRLAVRFLWPVARVVGFVGWGRVR